MVLEIEVDKTQEDAERSQSDGEISVTSFPSLHFPSQKVSDRLVHGRCLGLGWAPLTAAFEDVPLEGLTSLFKKGYSPSKNT